MIERRIFVIRERQVMLDEDLAGLYGVETKRLIEQVKRNLERFPEDFMFQLDREEAAALRSQSATSNAGRGGRRYSPYVFTEQGVAMLSSVLRSKTAIAVNIEVMRTFVELRRVASSYAVLEERLEQVDALFLMIGADPKTGWLPAEIAQSDGGFIRTGADVDEAGVWPLGRSPLSLETSMPGVFAAGDVRHGSMNRVASAVGEGSIAIRLIHELFELEQLRG